MAPNLLRATATDFSKSLNSEIMERKNTPKPFRRTRDPHGRWHGHIPNSNPLLLRVAMTIESRYGEKTKTLIGKMLSFKSKLAVQ
jgi:hypothetical protein